jgi:hypothetical protein
MSTPEHRLYTVQVMTECLCYATSPEEAEELAIDQYLKDTPEWTTRALLSRVDSATPNHDARYNTLGWYDHSAVYTTADIDDTLTVSQAVALDRETAERPVLIPPPGHLFVARCFTVSGQPVEIELAAINIFEAVHEAVKYPGIRNVASVVSVPT